MKLSISKAPNGVCIVRVEETTIELANAPGLRSSFATATEGAERVVIDLGSVQFIDSSGVGVLFGIAREARTRGRRIAVASPCPAVLRIFDLVHLARLVPVAASLDEAFRMVT